VSWSERPHDPDARDKCHDPAENPGISVVH
jgi:hypothetical protein